VNFKNRFLTFWKDPVWSNVIAAGIIAGFGFLVIGFFNRVPSLAVWSKPLTISLLVGILFIGSYLVIRALQKPDSRMLVFVSSGGTCRDPMAKAITTKLLEERNLKHPLKIKAAALGHPAKSEASGAARYVIKEMYGEDLLAHHKPESLTPETIEQADLILVMDHRLLLTRGKTLPPEKTYILKEFFGLEGDIVDPWPDGKDQATLTKYRKCAKELEVILRSNIEQLIGILEL
jgi:protein-tyrosine-phosphatase